MAGRTDQSALEKTLRSGSWEGEAPDEPNRATKPMKAELRQQMRAEAKKHSAEERRVASAQLCAVLRPQPVWQTSRTVLLFAPTADEPDISPLLTEAIHEGKTVALPAFSQSSGAYQALQVR